MPSQTATILVTDLVGSTELRSRLGEEAADRLHRLHERLLRDAVESHGGSVVKGLGDGVLAGFTGAADAVAAAVAIQQAADFHSRRHPDLALVVRVGLSAGDVTVEEDGDHVGTPVIEAARLCAAAAGGQILAADLVRALTRGRGGHRFSAFGDLELKGLAEPVTALEIGWEADRPVGAEVPFPPLLSGGGVFAGRAAQLQLLEAAWKEAVSGVRRAALVAGEAGVGKTRLCAELARRVHDGGGAVLYGRCEEDLGVPYEPFVEALRWFCEHVPAGELMSRLGRYPAELARLLPELGRLVPDLEPPLRSDPDTEQYRFFEAVASWLAAAGDPGGMLLVVDDLHWAPAPTIALLAHVLRSGDTGPLFVMATFRDTDIDPTHPLTPVLADLRRGYGIDRLALGGLSVDEVTQLLEGLPHAQTARALAVTLHDATEGNPFFVAEVLRDVAESGRSPGTVPVPEGVRDVIMARIARLNPSSRQLLGVAAVLGRNFELGPIALVAGAGEEAAVGSLDEAIDARLVEETDVGAYRFVHALVRTGLYESLSATRRAQLHLRAADVFEQRGGDPARLAHHLVAAAPLAAAERAASACLAAGDQALSVLADAEAAAWYTHGLPFAENNLDLRIDLLTGLGEAQRRTGDPASRQTLLDAARRAADRADVARLVRAVLANSRGFFSVVGQVDEERLELIATALDLVGPAPSAERAELLALQAAELVFAVDHERRLRAADEALAIADRLQDVTVRARIGVRRAYASLSPDRVASSVSEAAEVSRLADASRDPQLRALARVAAQANALLLAGDLEEARRRTTEAMAIADDTGQPGLRWIVHVSHAGAVDALGDHQEAERLTHFALELGQQAAYSDAAMIFAGRMVIHWAFEGQPDIAATVATEGFAASQMPLWHAISAFFLGLAGQATELADLLADVPSVLPRVPVDPLWPSTHFGWGVAQGFGAQNVEAAAAVYKALLPYRSLHAASGSILYWGPMELALGILARVLGDVDGALAHHQSAAEIIETSGAARARALNGYQWARTLLTRGAPGDRKRATEIAEETLAYCRTKGYTTFITKTEELLTRMT